MCLGVPPPATGPRFLLWDLPVRLFHWLLVAAVATAIATGFIGGPAMPIHGMAGLAVLGLLTFRLVWGFVGGTYARFASFVRGPAAIRAYLQGTWHGAGHNPLGALSVLALLTAMAVQVGTGLFANDDIAFNAPLYTLVSKETSDALTGWHIRSIWALLGLVALHLAAIAYYVRVRKDNLLKPMLTGWKEGEGVSSRGGGFPVFVLACAIAGLAVWTASGAFNPPPPPPPVETPAW